MPRSSHVKLLALGALLLPLTAHANPDADFRATATAHASATKRKVVAWGTAKLDGSARRYRFATLEATGKFAAYENGPLVCGDPAASVACRGAYLIEETPGKLWVVSFSDDRWGDTRSFHQGTGSTVSFEAYDDDAISHAQMHNHGTEEIRFGFRGGRLSMLEIHDVNRQGEDARTCRSKTCPALEKFEYHLVDYLFLQISGPFKPSTIRERTPPDEG